MFRKVCITNVPVTMLYANTLSVAVTPIIGLSLVVLVFGYLLSVFRMKYGGYPYRYILYGVTVRIMLIDVHCNYFFCLRMRGTRILLYLNAVSCFDD